MKPDTKDLALFFLVLLYPSSSTRRIRISVVWLISLHHLHCGFRTLRSVLLLSCYPDAGWQASSGRWLGSLGPQTSCQVLIQTLPMSPLPYWLGRGWSWFSVWPRGLWILPSCTTGQIGCC